MKYRSGACRVVAIKGCKLLGEYQVAKSGAPLLHSPVFGTFEAFFQQRAELIVFGVYFVVTRLVNLLQLDCNAGSASFVGLLRRSFGP